MSTDDGIRWDRQHGSSRDAEPPAAFLRMILESDAWPVLSGNGLDIACGKGRNAIYLAQRGFAVTALDISAVALAEGRRRARTAGSDHRLASLRLECKRAGVCCRRFRLIVNFNYLSAAYRPSSRR